MLALFEEAERYGITIYTGNLPHAKAIALPGFIALDWRMVGTVAEERTNTAHEMGHCRMNAFYGRNDPSYIIKRNENKADKWAIKKLVPKDELDKAVSLGYTETWQLAEYFDVTEEFMIKVIWYYQHGNLAVERRA